MMNRAVELLGQLMAYAKRLRFVAANYAADLERRPHRVRRGKTASPAQVEAMRDYFIEKDRLGYATLISVSAYVGIRPDETLNLHWEHLHGRRFLIDPDIAKTNVSRYPEIPDPVMADLAQWKLVSGSPVGLIFPRTKDGMPWRKTDRDNWRARWFRPAEEAAGLEGFRPYDLRHTCARLVSNQRPLACEASHTVHRVPPSQPVSLWGADFGHPIAHRTPPPATTSTRNVRRKFGEGGWL
jgi:integrase